MTARGLGIALAIALAAACRLAAADPAARKVIVLPLDGTAAPAVREALAGDVAAAARAAGDDVTAGTTTFRETAAAVGCDPDAPGCAATVVSTLGVDEIVYGTATAAGAATHVRLARAGRDAHTDREFDVPAGGDPGAEVRALFGGPAPPSTAAAVAGGTSPAEGTPPGGAASAGGVAAAAPTSTFFDTREREIGFGCAAGGGLAIVIGLALWASESSLQTQVDDAPTTTLADVQALRALEDRANNYAWGGNAMVILGFAAAGVGAYYFWIDHRARATAAPAVVPVVAPTDGGAVLVLGGAW